MSRAAPAPPLRRLAMAEGAAGRGRCCPTGPVLLWLRGARMAEEDAADRDVRALRERLLELIGAFEVSAAIGAVARLGVADALAGDPLPATEIAARVGADWASLERTLRLLIEFDLFERLPDGRFALTDAGELLRSDVSESVRMSAILSTEEWHWRAYGHFTHSVRTGKPGFAAAHGCRLWQYLEAHPEAAATFNDAMAQSVERRAAAFARSYDFKGIERLVDVGGGCGALIGAVLEAHPQMGGMLFDQASAIAGARKWLAAAGLVDRCELVVGDFFDTVPARGDAYVLSRIIHDWDDQDAERILTNVRKAAADEGRLLLIEMVIQPDDTPHPSTKVDLTMLVVAGGRERTEAEYRDLYANSGFELTRILPLDSGPWSVIEGTPV
jgi:hypothetical protein